MTNLLVMKEYLKRLYGRYEDYIIPILKFILGLILFSGINSRLGYMQRLDHISVVLVASLLSSFLPLGAMAFLAAVMILLHLWVLSVECTAIAAVLFMFIFLLYFRFSPQSSLLLLVTPILFWWRIPYIIPIAAGLLAAPAAAVPVVCGIVIYYFLNYVEASAASFGGGGEISASMVQRSRDIADAVIGNREMMIVAAAFVITILLVYFIRRLSIDYAWGVAILAGSLTDVVILLIGDLLFDANFSLGGVIFGSLLAIVLAFLLQFFWFNLDYARTEKVQFEDDEYYYYVKAVPKMTLSVPEKKVKRITTQKAHRNARSGNVRNTSVKSSTRSRNRNQ